MTIYVMQVCKSKGKNIFQTLKNRSFLEKIGLSEYALKIRVTPKKSENLAVMLRDPSPYLHELHRKPLKTPKG